MTRVKRGTIAHKKRERLLRHTRGFKWGRKSKARAAQEAVLHAWAYQFKSRKLKKRDFRKLWNVQINAASRENGLPYGKFIAALKKKNIELDRKILAEFAEKEPQIFKKIVEAVK
ncbi:MAG: 50S ribosomal protein L20 [bacterium]|nr:50S ribosomal protein L20 [bacterium]